MEGSSHYHIEDDKSQNVGEGMIPAYWRQVDTDRRQV
jgi:hypothetical protein